MLVLSHVVGALPAHPHPTHLLMLDTPAGLCKHRLETPVQCPPLIPLAPWHRDAPQDGSCHPSMPWTRASSLFSLCSSLHTPGTRWQEPGLTERGRFPGSEQPCRSPLLLARRRDRGGDFTNSSGIRLPKQSCGAQDDIQEHQPTTKRICKPGARLR